MAPGDNAPRAVLGRPPIEGTDEELEAWASDFVDQALGPASISQGIEVVDGYDIIGDVHGCADQLVGLLEDLGYARESGTYRHPKRQAIFVGDLIDRGPQQVETISIVRPMVESGAAQIVMGNHEFNAISFATPNPEIPGEFMRPHSDKNRSQHKSFIDQVQVHTGLYAQCIEWFRTMPLYLDLVGVRIVHACWNAEAIATVDKWSMPGIPMSTEFVIKANQKGTDEHHAIEILLKGPELSLIRNHAEKFIDKDGHPRGEARIRWWDASAVTLRDLAEIPGDAKTPEGSKYPTLSDKPCPGEAVYDYGDEIPVFYGHYWRKWPPRRGQEWTGITVCVDFSAVKGGPLVCYRWDSGKPISDKNFVRHGGS